MKDAMVGRLTPLTPLGLAIGKGAAQRDLSGLQEPIESPSKMSGVAREVEGLDSDLGKLQSLLQDLRSRMEPSLKPSQPMEPSNKTNEARPQGSPMAEALGGLRYRVRCAMDIVNDLHSRLDI